MNSISHHVLFARPASQIPVVALLFVLSGCATRVTPPASPESQVIAEADLPAGRIAPRVVRVVAPVFPDELKRAGVEGEVRLACLVNEKGEVRHVALAGATNAQFVEPARQALQKWTFTPGSLDGQPVAMSLMIPIRFTLVDSDSAPKPRAGTTTAVLLRP